MYIYMYTLHHFIGIALGAGNDTNFKWINKEPDIKLYSHLLSILILKGKSIGFTLLGQFRITVKIWALFRD